mmetsp:Transcript_11351/g.15927  ORF Transcript_11351/g.15927 Transcript_11351/m.15927 type:complete len:136 (+) Transcript_11351:398-805(+)
MMWSLMKTINGKSFEIKQLKEFVVEKVGLTIIDSKTKIEAIEITKNKILAGTRAGDIFEFDRDDEELKGDEPRSMIEINDTRYTRLNANNDEVSKCVAFSQGMDKVFSVTKNGLFSVYELKHLIISKQIQLKSTF